MTDTTFRQIEQILQIKDEGKQPKESLEIWYESVRDKILRDFSVEDICKACRQKLYPDYIVPHAIARLQSDSFAGEMYDGELLVSLTKIGAEYWQIHDDQANTLKQIIASLPGNIDDDLGNDVKNLMSKLPQ